MLKSHLEYFIEIVDQNSFTKAAENLYLSQSTLSKAVKSLEDELGVVLINRTSHMFEITDHGKIVYEFGKDIVGYYERKEAELLRRLSEEEDHLSLGLPPTAGSIYFYQFLAGFQEKFPNVNLVIDESRSKEISEKVLSRELDLGVVISPFEEKGFLQETVFTSEAVLVVSHDHPLATVEEVSFPELAKEKFLQVSKDYMYHKVFREYCKKAGFEPNIIFESNQWDMLLEMVAMNQGVSLLPKPLVDKYYQGRLHQVHLKEPEFPWSLIIIYKEDEAPTPLMKSFILSTKEEKETLK